MHALEKTRRVLHPRHRQYLESLPARLPIDENVVLDPRRRAQRRAIHDRSRGTSWRTSSTCAATFPGRRICFFGHTHAQKVYEVEGSTVRELPAHGTVILREDREYFLNAGSVDAVAQARREARGVCDLRSDRLILEFFQISYNDDLTEEKASAGAIA
jgi:hypothetical protein